MCTIVYAFHTFRHFSSQSRFPVSAISDRRSQSKSIFTTDLLKSHECRLGLWWTILSAANFRIEHRNGEENTIAGFLTRS